MKESIRKRLLELVKHKSLYFTSRGNTAIHIALEFAREKGIKKLFIQDQGRWMTYKKIAADVGLDVVELKTDYGLLRLESLHDMYTETSALLYTNPAGYLADQDMQSIYEEAKKWGALVICDMSGGLGEDFVSGKFADVCIGSFGRWKPLWLGEGGFVSFQENLVMQVEEPELDYEKLGRLLEALPKRLEKLHADCDKIKQDLRAYDIVHPDKKGIVVVVELHSPDEKEKILSYCNEHDFEYEECPREIRVTVPAISIEVKRRKYYIDV